MPSSTLRYWEREGLIATRRQDGNDYRTYDLHDLFAAGEVAFYRRLGVPLNALKGYRSLPVEELDAALTRTDAKLEAKIREMESMRQRLSHQRELMHEARMLADCEPHITPLEIKRLVSLDYAERLPWELILHEPWRYGVMIRAESPDTVVDTIIAEADEKVRGEVLWERADLGCRGMEALLRVDDADRSNAAVLFDAAWDRGMDATLIVGSYLVGAAESRHRWSLYRAWVV